MAREANFKAEASEEGLPGTRRCRGVFGRGGRRIGNRVYSECTAARYRTPPRHYAR